MLNFLAIQRREFQFAFSFFAAHSGHHYERPGISLGCRSRIADNLSVREIVDELLLLEAVKTRLAKSERGEPGVPHDDVVKMLDAWITR